ncbi:mechanosensitive ion channel family protein [Porphyrobacter sp. ULC335]|uniref:mechanosensitive ion channel family protein n=1 Tax=Porphyrobacter sp. ULC335 TaxID=2854260 RepID=UPI00221FFDBA|nr:mechanosensitive ion channel domain-containing protein [Porphyrobacter sp. ULC335]UYV17260.1 mechanosensitive ion channel [Porphyrobacter sp. ULC335]
MTAPTPAAPETVGGADVLREDLAERSQTVGDIANRLDAFALEIGTWRVSAFDVLFTVAAILLVLGFALVATRLTRSALRRLTALDGTQRVLAEKIASIVIWVVTFLVGVDLLGIDLTALTVFSGAFGLAIGFGLQKTFGNLISGIILLMDKSIKPGDVIAVSDQTGQQTFGQIRKIGIRAVSVTTRDEREYLIPNENLMINQVENWSYSSKNVRVQVPVGVSYDADMALAEKLMLEAAAKARRVLATPSPSVWWSGFGDNAVNFTIHCWINDPEEGVGNVRSDVLKHLWGLFKEHGVALPFPQRDLNLRDSDALDRVIAALEERRGDTPQ